MRTTPSSTARWRTAAHTRRGYAHPCPYPYPDPDPYPYPYPYAYRYPDP